MTKSQKIARILVPFDFEPASYRALESATAIAEGLGARIDLFHVLPSLVPADPSMLVPDVMGYALPEGHFEAAKKEAGKRLDHVLAGIDTKTVKGAAHIGVGDARAEILRKALADHVDLIVMGTHGRTGVERVFLGSVADRITHTATCPVMLVR